MRPESLYEAISWKGRIPVVGGLGFDCENRLPTADLLLICHEFRCRSATAASFLSSQEALALLYPLNSRKYSSFEAAMVVLGARSICAWGWVDTFGVQLDWFSGAKDISGPPKMRLECHYSSLNPARDFHIDGDNEDARHFGESSVGRSVAEECLWIR